MRKKIEFIFCIFLIFCLGIFFYPRVKVSVIVPVYNTEQYLEECFNSLQNQTLKDLEFVVIDDGSTDKSFEIMQKYAAKDKRFRIFHQENKGVGKTRNFGIEQARGKYVGFVDSDDYVSENYFEKLYEKANRYNADISIITDFRWGVGEESSNHSILRYLHTRWGKMNDVLFLVGTEGQQADKIYKKDFLERYNIRSLGDGFVYEDEWFTTLVFLYARNAVAVEGATYYYRQRDDSVSRKKSISDASFRYGLDVYESLLKKVNDSIMNQNKRYGAIKRLFGRIDWYLFLWSEFCDDPEYTQDWYARMKRKYLF